MLISIFSFFCVMASVGRSSRRRQQAPKTQREIIEEGNNFDEIAHGEARKYCVQFGAQRKTLYPGFFFCHECDLAEDYFCSPHTLGKWPKNWANSKYCCKANHLDAEHPTDVGVGWSGAKVQYSELFEKKPAAKKNPQPPIAPPTADSQVLVPQESTVRTPTPPNLPQGTQVDNPPFCPEEVQIDSPVIAHQVICVDSPRRSPRKRQATNAPGNEPVAQRPAHNTLINTWENDVFKFEKQIKRLKAEISQLKKERGVYKRKLTMEEKKSNSLQMRDAVEHKKWKNLSVEKLIPQVLNEFLDKYQSRTGGARIGKALVKTISDPQFRGGCCLPALRTFANSDLRQNYFTPQACAKAADLSGGKLNGTTWTVVRDIYTRGRKNVRDCPIPSSSTVYAAKKVVEERADKLIPFQVFDQASGEGIRFEPMKLTEFILSAYGLSQKAKNVSIEMPLTYDGAQLTHKTSHVTMGLKVTDLQAINPRTKLPLGEMKEMNSPEHSHPFIMVIGKESNEMMKENFKYMFDFFKSASNCQEPQLFENPFSGKYKKFNLCVPADMSAHWKSGLPGGTAKRVKYFCNCCSNKSSEIATANKELCEVCENLQGEFPGLKCYHHSMSTPERVLAMENKAKFLVREWSVQMDIVEKTTKIKLYEQNNPQKDTDPLSIDFVPETINEKVKFASLLTSELVLRGMPPMINTPRVQRVEVLRERRTAEIEVNNLLGSIDHEKPNPDRLFDLIMAIPCILHLEMRVGIKMLSMIVVRGIYNARKDILPWQMADENRSKAENPRIKQFVDKLEKTVNEQILGTEKAPAQWQLHFEDNVETGNKWKLCPISMTNGTVRSIIENFHLLVNISESSAESKAKWNKSLNNYREALSVLLKKKENYTEAELKKFEKHIAFWFNDYVSLTGKDGCTNYTHLLSAGHVLFYMKKYGNLSKFSNQGWESLNAMIKTYFFRSTNRGGGGGAGENRTKSKLLAIGKWLQRRLLWLCYDTETLFENNIVTERNDACT